ncbi:MAG: hypothetical protein IT285_11640 [Bdellovibrionales bacterium]|nr:hypothetical protein [Bdellovibrionales bacterium]
MYHSTKVQGAQKQTTETGLMTRVTAFAGLWLAFGAVSAQAQEIIIPPTISVGLDVDRTDYSPIIALGTLRSNGLVVGRVDCGLPGTTTTRGRLEVFSGQTEAIGSGFHFDDASSCKKVMTMVKDFLGMYPDRHVTFTLNPVTRHVDSVLFHHSSPVPMDGDEKATPFVVPPTGIIPLGGGSSGAH